MSVNASGSMNCNGDVHVVVVNNTSAAFQGQSSTTSSWNVPLDLAPGAAQVFDGHFGVQVTRVDGAVHGVSVEGQVWTTWTAARPAECGAVPTIVPTPVDTTPVPITTIKPGDPQMCVQPGSLPPLAVPCDSPEATTPYTVPTIASSVPVDAAVDTVATTEAPTIDTAAQAIVSVKPKAHKPVDATLPATGGGGLGGGLLGGAVLAVGVVLAVITRRRSRTTVGV